MAFNAKFSMIAPTIVTLNTMDEGRGRSRNITMATVAITLTNRVEPAVVSIQHDHGQIL